MENNNNLNLKEQIENFKEQYFIQNKKNIFFKNKQKMEIAEHISKSFDLNDLIHQTCFIIPNTNKIFLDYTIFKLYANENNYETILKHIIELYMNCIETNQSFEVHVNLESLTPSATEKYKNCIELFNRMTNDCLISQYLNNWYVYNPPSMIDMIKQILKYILDPIVMKKVIVYPKIESNERLTTLLNL
jgi:hypothetical protein